MALPSSSLSDSVACSEYGSLTFAKCEVLEPFSSPADGKPMMARVTLSEMFTEWYRRQIARQQQQQFYVISIYLSVPDE